MDYRATPYSTMNVSPAELFLSRPLHTHFDLLKLQVKNHVLARQADHKLHHDKSSKHRIFMPGQPVMLRDFRHYQDKWIPGIFKEKLDLSHSVSKEKVAMFN